MDREVWGRVSPALAREILFVIAWSLKEGSPLPLWEERRSLYRGREKEDTRSKLTHRHLSLGWPMMYKFKISIYAIIQAERQLDHFHPFGLLIPGQIPMALLRVGCCGGCKEGSSKQAGPVGSIRVRCLREERRTQNPCPGPGEAQRRQPCDMIS